MALLCLGHSALSLQPPLLSCLRLELLSFAPQAGAGVGDFPTDPCPASFVALQSFC